MKDFRSLTEQIVAFCQAREWQRFHTPKELASAISIESMELVEIFLWKDTKQVDQIVQDPTSLNRVESEIADIGIYLLLLCNQLDIDLSGAIERKLSLNEQKYPVDKARGNSKKYDTL